MGGGSYCSTSVQWEDLPEDGMLGYVILFDQRADSGRRHHRIASGRDWYWMSPGVDGNPIFAESNDTKEEILDRYPGAILRRGKWTSDPEMYRVLRHMNEWDL